MAAARKKATGDEKVGVDIIERALTAPIKQIAENGGLDGSVVCVKVEESDDVSFGFNAANRSYEDLVKAGVIVPTKVERVALQNAASISGLLLTTDCVEVKEKAKAGPGPRTWITKSTPNLLILLRPRHRPEPLLVF